MPAYIKAKHIAILSNHFLTKSIKFYDLLPIQSKHCKPIRPPDKLSQSKLNQTKLFKTKI